MMRPEYGQGLDPCEAGASSTGPLGFPTLGCCIGVQALVLRAPLHQPPPGPICPKMLEARLQRREVQREGPCCPRPPNVGMDREFPRTVCMGVPFPAQGQRLGVGSGAEVSTSGATLSRQAPGCMWVDKLSHSECASLGLLFRLLSLRC